MREAVNWQEFTARHNMTWSKKSSSWDSGAWLGNGCMGAMVYSAEDKTKRNTLRWLTGRTDVEARTPDRPGVYTRVPLGELDLEMEGWIFDGTSMELDLYQAELKADLVTTKGKVKVRGLVHSLEQVMVVEAEPDDNESVKLIWRGYPEVSPIMKNEDGINYNQYIPDIRLEEQDRGQVHVQIQRFFEPGKETTKDGCVVASIAKVQGKKTVYYLTVAKGCDEKAVCEAVETVNRGAGADLNEWTERHRQWWRDYYKKSFVSFTDTRLEGFYLIQMYKLACAARKGQAVMDNQGPWMAATPWPRAWYNMNVQTAYSPVYTSNHLEIGESLCDSLDQNIENLIHNVEEEYQKDSAGLGRSAGCNMASPVEDCTYDLSLLRWGLKTLMEICDTFSMEDPDRALWEQTLDRLTEYHQDETGFMIGKDVPLDFGHRHFSHLLPVFPLHLISGDEEKEKELIVHCLRHWFHREGDLRGFTFSGAASIAATVGRGDEALAYVKSALHLFKPNTMYTEAGPVIESPLGVAESIQDILLQSWGSLIRVFPAVPGEWRDVTFHNLRAEGGFLISAVRREGKTSWIRVESLAGEPCCLKTDLGPEVHGAVSEGREVSVDEKEGILRLDLKEGEEIFLFAGEEKPDFVIEPVKAQRHMRNFFGEHKPWRLYGIPFSWEA
ncbi:MAG: hypothetical protein HFG66_15520 [Hungatella sp.]|nr:hypothetical protein [Hungatella sp.]